MVYPTQIPVFGPLELSRLALQVSSEQAVVIERTTAVHSTPGRYQPPDTLMAFSRRFYYADPIAASAVCSKGLRRKVGIIQTSA